jgi:hypothetical protein
VRFLLMFAVTWTLCSILGWWGIAPSVVIGVVLLRIRHGQWLWEWMF